MRVTRPCSAQATTFSPGTPIGGSDAITDFSLGHDPLRFEDLFSGAQQSLDALLDPAKYSNTA
jgi:hypothetical protein